MEVANIPLIGEFIIGNYTRSKVGQPWLHVNLNYSEIKAEGSLGDPDSVFFCYRKLIQLRKSNPTVVSNQ
ncbi:alpha-amylase family glycosyl hydrolase [Paenibacillus sp. FSL R5-0378]|uniref:alpha-amylase family glycosyl hydrolase n=1 Tax=Paenibacillus sp. FSL R5-0378 TaxID=2921637 RepID=UPI004046BEB9